MFQLSLTRKLPLLLLIGLLVTTPVAAQGGATIRLDPPTVALDPGETAEVTVWLEGVTELAGAEVHLTYDPERVEVVDADPASNGVQIAHGTFLSADFVAQNQADPNAGTIDYAVAQMPPHEPVSGDGPLAVITLRGVAEGEAGLAVQSVLLANQDAQPIPVVVETAAPETTTNPPAAPSFPVACWPWGMILLGAAGIIVERKTSQHKTDPITKQRGGMQ